MQFSPDEKRITVRQNNVIELWDIETQAFVYRIENTQTFFSDVAFSPDNRYLATVPTSNNLLGTAIWDAQNGELLHELIEDEADHGFGNWAGSVSFSPDSQYLATAYTIGEAQVWSVDNFFPIKYFSRDSASIGATSFGKLHFLPNNKQFLFATTDNDSSNIISLEDVESGSQESFPIKTYRHVSVEDLSSDGKSILFTTPTGHAYIFNFEKPSPLVFLNQFIADDP